MAMKVLPLQPNDHRSIRRVADEFRIFEGISHPHLVKCYGVEIHNVRLVDHLCGQTLIHQNS